MVVPSIKALRSSTLSSNPSTPSRYRLSIVSLDQIFPSPLLVAHLAMERKRQRLSEALAIVPFNKFDKIRKLLQADVAEGEPSQSTGRAADGYGKRSARRVLQPAFDAFASLTVTGQAGSRISDISFWCADLERVLEYVLQRCEAYSAAFAAACDPHKKILITLYGDESTGGNVLQVASSKKVFFPYFAAHGCLSPLLEVAWLPYSCIPARDLALVKGGFSAVMASLCRDFQRQMEKGITIKGVRYALELHAYLGDYDGCTRAVGAMGAAALKPCMLCMNVLQRQSELPRMDGSFVGVGCSETRRFQPLTQADLERMYDDKLELVNGSAAKRKQFETLFGFHIMTESVLGCAVARKVLPLRKVMYDTLHNYYANGILALEVLLLLGKVEELTGIGLPEIRSSLMDVTWQTSSAAFRAPSARRFLFHDKLWQGDFYKGSASQLYQLLPLFCYYVHMLMPMDSPYVLCFDALMRAPRRATHIHFAF